MKHFSKTGHNAKSPMVLLFLISVLVISTLVVASDYFLRPQIELELKQKITQYFTRSGITNRDISNVSISGRDVTLNGKVSSKALSIKAEKVTEEVTGIRHIDNQLLIRN